MPRSSVTEGNLREFYDVRYDAAYMEDHEILEFHRVVDTLSNIPISPTTILDYGCGRGRWIPLLSRKFPEARITGVDISDKAITRAVRRFSQHRFQWLNGESAPFEDGSFDLVFSYHVLEHVSTVEPVVHDMSRLVRNGGYLCIICPCANEGSLEEKTTSSMRGGQELSADGRRRFFYEDAGHIRRLRSREIIDMFAGHGVTPYKELFGDQCLGSVRWMSRLGPNFIRQSFDVTRGTSTGSKARLILLQAICAPLSIPVKLYGVNLNRHLRTSKSTPAKILLAGMWSLKILATPFGALVDLLALLEWWTLKTKKNGAVQFLILKKV